MQSSEIERDSIAVCGDTHTMSTGRFVNLIMCIVIPERTKRQVGVWKKPDEIRTACVIVN